jgi:outer membrane protein W
MKKLIFTALLLTALPLAAQSTDVTVWVSSQMNSDGGRFADDEDAEVRFDNGSGYGVSVSRAFTRRLSGELALFRTSSSAEIREGTQRLDLGDIELTPITAMLRYHVAHGARAGAYVGAGLAHVMADDLDTADLRALGIAPVRLDSETAAVIGAGVTIDLNARWGLAVDARYIPLELSGRAAGDSDRLSVDMDPLLISGGVRVRF